MPASAWRRSRGSLSGQRLDKAKAYHAEWTALLEPFARVATPDMMAGAGKPYDRMGEWSGQPGGAQPPFPTAVWAFIKEVGRAAKE